MTTRSGLTSPQWRKPALDEAFSHYAEFGHGRGKRQVTSHDHQSTPTRPAAAAIQTYPKAPPDVTQRIPAVAGDPGCGARSPAGPASPASPQPSSRACREWLPRRHGTYHVGDERSWKRQGESSGRTRQVVLISGSRHQSQFSPMSCRPFPGTGHVNRWRPAFHLAPSEWPAARREAGPSRKGFGTRASCLAVERFLTFSPTRSSGAHHGVPDAGVGHIRLMSHV